MVVGGHWFSGVAGCFAVAVSGSFIALHARPRLRTARLKQIEDERRARDIRIAELEKDLGIA